MEENSGRYNLFNQLVDVTKSLYQIINLIYEMEVNAGQGNLYYELVDSYKKLLVQEDEVYNCLFHTEDMLIDYINYLHDRFNIDEVTVEPESIMSIEENIIYKRMFSKMSEYVFKLPFNDDEENDEYDDCFSNRTKEEREIIRKKCIVNEYVEKDMLMLFLSIVKKNIDLEELKEYRKDLLKIKYNLAFVFGKVEYDLLSDKFVISDSPYMVSKMTSDLLFISSNDYEMIKLLALRNNINDNIRYIMGMEKDIEEFKKEIFLKTVISSFLLESAMLFNTHDECEVYFEKESGRQKSLANYRIISLKKS